MAAARSRPSYQSWPSSRRSASNRRGANPSRSAARHSACASGGSGSQSMTRAPAPAGASFGGSRQKSASAIDEAGDANGVKAEFFARLEPRREDWALRMLRSAHVLKGAGSVDWKTFTGTTKALLDGQALETIPIMKYVWERTNRDLAREKLLGGHE